MRIRPDWRANHGDRHSAAPPLRASTGRARSHRLDCALMGDRRFRSRYWLETGSANRTQTGPRGAKRYARHIAGPFLGLLKGFPGGGWFGLMPCGVVRVHRALNRQRVLAFVGRSRVRMSAQIRIAVSLRSVVHPTERKGRNPLPMPHSPRSGRTAR